MTPRTASRWTRWLAAGLAAASLLCAAAPAAAQSGSDFTQQELDQMLAPIALYPDALLSQITMAATYPQEVVEAARWSAANRSLRGERAVRAVEGKDWDPSVMSLVAFPQILRMMGDKLDWTEDLGDAFLGQERQVMDTVQDLRQRAYRAGNLRSNAQSRVDRDGDYITIGQADPQYAYEPYYNPSVVYGSWWWPQAQPVSWAAWPGYRERSGFGNGFAWGAMITLGSEFFFGAFDWNQHRVNVVNVNNYYYPRDTRVAPRAPRQWAHAPDHRRGTPYRAPEVRSKYQAAASVPRPRDEYRGRLPGTQAPRGDGRPEAGKDAGKDARADRGTRSDSRGAAAPAATPPATRQDERKDGRNDGRGNRPANAATPATPATAATPAIPATPATPKGADTPRNRDNGGEARANRNDRADRGAGSARQGTPAPVAAARPAAVPAPAAQRPHALENVGRGAETRDASARGRASRDAARPAATPAPTTAPRAAAPPSPPPRAAAPAAPARPAPPAAAPARPASPPAAAPPAAPKQERDRKGRERDEK